MSRSIKGAASPETTRRLRTLSGNRSMNGARQPKGRKDSELIAAVDIGASKTACLIAHLAPSVGGRKAPEVIGVGRHGGAPGERGDNRLASAEAAIRGAVEAAERMAGERVNAVHISIPGRLLHCRRLAIELDVEGGLVTREDVEECLVEGAASAAGEGRAPVHALPIGYTLDGEDVGADPCGLAGAALTAEMLGVGVRQAQFRNLEALIERCGLRIEDAAAGPLAAAEAVLFDDEKDLGVVLIDMGSRSSDYAVFDDGALIDCGGVGLGGDHVTRDIAQIFGASLRDAERAKTLYGAALIGVGDEHRLVDLKQLGEQSDVVRVSRAEISAVITPRLEEILELVQARLPADARARHGLRRVVMTGGGSLLVGAREAAERVLGMKARLARPSDLAGAPDAATAPQFSVCAGLIQRAAKQKYVRGGAESWRRAAPLRAGRGVFGGVGQWLREHF